MDDLEAAWDELHDVVPAGWVAGRPILRDDTSAPIALSITVADARSKTEILRGWCCRFRSIVPAAILTTAAAAACDSTGTAVFALNESDHEVVVDVRSGVGSPSKIVAAHAAGTVFTRFGNPGGNWSVVVLDGSCQRLGEYPIRTNGSTIHIDPDGDIALDAGSLNPAGLAGIDLVTPVDARCP